MVEVFTTHYSATITDYESYAADGNPDDEGRGDGAHSENTIDFEFAALAILDAGHGHFVFRYYTTRHARSWLPKQGTRRNEKFKKPDIVESDKKAVRESRLLDSAHDERLLQSCSDGET
jgi:hypothetical protein